MAGASRVDIGQNASGDAANSNINDRMVVQSSSFNSLNNNDTTNVAAMVSAANCLASQPSFVNAMGTALRNLPLSAPPFDGSYGGPNNDSKR